MHIVYILIGLETFLLESDLNGILVQHFLSEDNPELPAAKLASLRIDSPPASCILFDCYISRIKDRLAAFAHEFLHIFLGLSL